MTPSGGLPPAVAESNGPTALLGAARRRDSIGRALSVIGGVELLTTAQRIYSVDFEVIALLIVASIWYLTVVSLLTIGQHVLERRLSRDRVGGDRSVRSETGPDLAGIDPQL